MSDNRPHSRACGPRVHAHGWHITHIITHHIITQIPTTQTEGANT